MLKSCTVSVSLTSSWILPYPTDVEEKVRSRKNLLKSARSLKEGVSQKITSSKSKKVRKKLLRAFWSMLNHKDNSNRNGNNNNNNNNNNTITKTTTTLTTTITI